jgi:glycosyltransferase involved in cell wall biosynthesis
MRQKINKANMKIKNIIVSTHDSLFPIKGGGALRTLRVAEEFRRRGNNVMIIAPTDGVGKLNGMRVHWLHPPRKQRSQILSSLKFNLRLLRKFLFLLEKVDILFVHNTISAATLPFLKSIFKFKFVLDISDIHAEYLPIGKRNIFEKILTPLLLYYEYYIIKKADFIIVVTNAMKQLLVSKKIAPEKIKVVYDGVDENGISNFKDKEAYRNIIHLGTIDRQHGVEVLIESIPIVLRKIHEAKFIFVGGGRELPNVKRQARRLGVIKNCIFTDYLPCGEARKYLQKAMIGVIPRRDYLPNRIITTLKIYEYWASGTAVVSSSLAGIKEVACDGKDVLFFQSDNAYDLASKLIFLFENPKLRNFLIKNGLKKVEKFYWSKLSVEVVNLSLNSDIIRDAI